MGEVAGPFPLHKLKNPRLRRGFFRLFWRRTGFTRHLLCLALRAPASAGVPKGAPRLLVNRFLGLTPFPSHKLKNPRLRRGFFNLVGAALSWSNHRTSPYVESMGCSGKVVVPIRSCCLDEFILRFTRRNTKMATLQTLVGISLRKNPSPWPT